MTFITYRQLLYELEGLSDKDLDKDVAIALVRTIEDSETTEVVSAEKLQVINEFVTRPIIVVDYREI